MIQKLLGIIIVDGTIPEPDPKVNNKVKKVHPGIVCNSCGNNIIGIRYKCTICHNFDYCEKCEEQDKGRHGHPFLKIIKPEMCPISISCRLNN